VVAWGRWTRVDWAAAGIILVTVLPLTLYWFSGGFYIGARYWFMAFLPLIWLSARGLLTINARLRAKEMAPAASRLGVSLAALMAVSVVMFSSWRGVTHFYEFRGYHDHYRAIARSAESKGAIVFVRSTMEGDWGSALALNDPLHLNRNGPLFLLDRGDAANAAAAAAIAHSKIIHVGDAKPGEKTF